MNIVNYMNDGADYQARAVLCVIQGRLGDGLECSWDDELKRYTAYISIARWANGREQGYVVSLRKHEKQINIAFFEHRNSDEICAVKWMQLTINAPTIDTADFGDIYKDKFDTSFCIGYGEYKKAADWIFDEIESFYKSN